MFWFHHPRPPSRKEVAEQVVVRKTAAPNVRVLVIERAAPAAAAAPKDRPAATEKI